MTRDSAQNRPVRRSTGRSVMRFTPFFPGVHVPVALLPWLARVVRSGGVATFVGSRIKAMQARHGAEV